MRRRPERAVLTCLIFALAVMGWSCRTLNIPPATVVMVSVTPHSDDHRKCGIEVSDGDDKAELAEIYYEREGAPDADGEKGEKGDAVFRPRQVLWIVDKPGGSRLTISQVQPDEKAKEKRYTGQEVTEDLFGRFTLRWRNAIFSGEPEVPAAAGFPLVWYYRLEVDGACEGEKDPAICVKGGGSGGCTFQQDP